MHTYHFFVAVVLFLCYNSEDHPAQVKSLCVQLFPAHIHEHVNAVFSAVKAAALWLQENYFCQEQELDHNKTKVSSHIY